MSYSSSKKEPVSMKLRVANMKEEEVHGMTKQLEEESRKMEDRLRELKLAMNREKELREQRGGGHWKSGKEGNLNSHAKDVLSKPPSKPSGSGKGRRVKVLKDEPVKISKTKDKPQPGTLAFLAQRDNSKPGLRPTGPICGQCEIKTAVVTCQECSEIYCSGCFTAFHLKGALAKHHSTPLSKIQSTPRDEPSNQPSAHLPRKPSPHTDQMRIVWEQHEVKRHNKVRPEFEEEEKEVEPQSSLLDGEYDEREAAQSFQQALSEWRKENTDPEPKKTISSARSVTKQISARKPTKLGTQKPNIPTVSPVHTPRVNVDEGTSTQGGSTKPTTSYKPEFHNSEITYAEKLLLKKNRRKDVPSINSSPAQFSNGFAHNDSEEAELDEEAVSFDSILATVQQSGLQGHLHGQDMSATPGTIVDIQELFVDETDGETADAESHYVVFEEVDDEPVAGDISGFGDQSRLRGRVTPSTSLQVEDVTDSLDISQSTQSITGTPDKSYKKQSGASGKESPPQVVPLVTKSLKPASRSNRPSSRAGTSQHSSSKTPRPASSLARPSSRNNTSFHRPARPRTAAEKAVDMFGDGPLTKRPSSALKDLISKYKNTDSSTYTANKDYTESLGEFFTVGVKKEFQERTLTPRRDKPASPGAPLKKHQISNKVYSLTGAKSWRPGSSLGDNVEEEQINKLCQEFDTSKLLVDPETDPVTDLTDVQTTLRYSWSASKDPASTNGVESVTASITQSLSERLSFGDYTTASAAAREAGPSVMLRGRSTLPASSHCPALPVNSPRPVSRAKTDYTVSKPKHGRMTPRSARINIPCSVRAHTPIVVDGDDMTQYDSIRLPQADISAEDEDLEAMNDLELELASQTGRLTADGRVSRLTIDEPEEVNGDDNMQHLPQRSLTMTPDTHRDIDRLRESLMDDFEETELLVMQDEAMRVSLL